MKTLVSTFILALAVAFTGPALAGDVSTATTKAACKEAGGKWKADTETCVEKVKKDKDQDQDTDTDY